MHKHKTQGSVQGKRFHSCVSACACACKQVKVKSKKIKQTEMQIYTLCIKRAQMIESLR